MSSNLKCQFLKLEIVAGLKSTKARKIILSEFSKDVNFCKAVRELVKNTVKKNIKLTESQKKKLRRYRSVLEGILKKKTSHKRRQALMCQTGTGVFLPIVVPIVASLLSELLKN